MRQLGILPRPDQATPAQVRAVTLAVAGWTVTWLVGAVLVAWYVHRLDRWAALLRSTAASLHRTAAALAPLLGHRGVVATLQGLSAQADASASATTSSVHQTAYLLGLAVGLIPTLPAVVLYVQFRRSRRKETRAVEAALRHPADRPAAVRYLAERMFDELALPDLLEVSGGAEGRPSQPPEPWREETMWELARAQAARLGLSPDVVASLAGGAGPDAPRSGSGGSDSMG